MRILGLIPARGGSKGIPGKNIKLLGGKPLLQYSFEVARKAEKLDRVILSSDDEGIIKISRDIGLEAPFQRPDSLAEDHTPSLEVILHALETLHPEKFDAVCLLQPTTPFRQNGLIDSAVEKLESGNYDSVISVRTVPEEFNPHWVFEERDGRLEIATGEPHIITRRQELPKAYHRDGAIYLTRTEVLLQQHSLFGKNIGFLDTSDHPFVNIDTEEDWKLAEKLLARCVE